MNAHDKTPSSFFLKFKKGPKDEAVFFEAVTGLNTCLTFSNFSNIIFYIRIYFHQVL